MPAHLIAEEGPLLGLVLNFEDGEDWIVGRDPDVADFVIEDSTVSRKHARITKRPQGLFLQNLSLVNPVLINDEEHQEPSLLKEGDRVQIGNNTFLFSEEGLPNSSVSAKKKKDAKKKDANGYDNIFGELEEPPPPPREETPEEKREEEETPTDPKIEAEETSYDTIFEDIESSGDIPFNLLQPSPLLLKVISGPNAGAEIGIEKDRSYILGKDPNSCDVVFQDLSVSRNHARLSVHVDGTIELEDLGSKNGTFVGGVAISSKTIVTPQDMVALGTTVFLIIDREAPQETIYSPSFPTYASPKIELGEGEEAEPEILEIEEFDWKKQPIPKKHLLLAGSLLTIFLIVFVSFFSLFKTDPIRVVRKEPVEHIKEALTKYKDIQFSFNPGSGKLFLTGHVLTAVDYQEMMFRVGQVSFIQDIDNTVVIDELLWKSMNDVLNNNPAWRTVSIHSPEAGKFVVTGYVQSNDQAAQLNEYLTVNFPYLDRLQNSVATEETLNLEVQNVLTTNGFGNISFQLSRGSLVLTGGFNGKLKPNYEKAIKELNALPGISRVYDLAISGTAETSNINITQQYQVGGSALYDGRGYNVVLNGRIYTMGDSVDGMEITSIEPKTILLEKDGLKYRIDYK